MPDPILKDRAQKFGRNVMAAAGVILVLAWVPGIRIDQFQPLGFKFNAASGSILSVWCLLAGILGYYFVRFSVDVTVNYLEWNPVRKADFRSWKHNKKSIRDAKKIPGAAMNEDWIDRITELRPKIIYARQFFVLEIGMPFVFFAAAAITVWLRIVANWPQGAPPTL